MEKTETIKNIEVISQKLVLPIVVVVVLLFYIHGKHLRSCRDGQLTYVSNRLRYAALLLLVN